VYIDTDTTFITSNQPVPVSLVKTAYWQAGYQSDTYDMLPYPDVSSVVTES
jgi:hypothetical protein